MKKAIFIFIIMLPLFFFSISTLEARQGCCSWHGGVCGCHCCDGSSLSAKCAPYYPSCNSAPTPIPTPSYTPSYSEPKTPDCPIHSSYNSSSESCKCDTGYYPSLSKSSCVEIPEHSHYVGTEKDVWQCDSGYVEVNNTCISECEIDNLTIKVTSVVDGDTIKINCNGKAESVRIIGIDTPETVDTRKPVQCFGKESSRKMTELVSNKEIILKKGKGSDNRDKYDRFLRYVYVNTQDIGETMIKEGYAFSYKTYPHEKLNQYNELEIQAKENEKGLWNTSICEYQAKKQSLKQESILPVTQKLDTIFSGFIFLLKIFFGI